MCQQLENTHPLQGQTKIIKTYHQVSKYFKGWYQTHHAAEPQHNYRLITKGTRICLEIKLLNNSKEFTVENRKTQVKKNENTAHQNSVMQGR